MLKSFNQRLFRDTKRCFGKSLGEGWTHFLQLSHLCAVLSFLAESVEGVVGTFAGVFEEVLGVYSTYWDQLCMRNNYITQTKNNHLTPTGFERVMPTFTTASFPGVFWGVFSSFFASFEPFTFLLPATGVALEGVTTAVLEADFSDFFPGDAANPA